MLVEQRAARIETHAPDDGGSRYARSAGYSISMLFMLVE
jgi:hypothetical protein